jgi:PAS domain S-box-containing protein
MKISFENKIFAGFVINLLVVVASGWVFVARLEKDRDLAMDSTLNWIELSLFILSIILLTIVYFIIRFQLRAKNSSQNSLLENKQLLQSIIDNTSNPIFIKKINGEYLLVNKQFESLFQISNEDILGKTDHDFLPKEIADAYRNSDFEVVKALRELKTEEIIQQADGPHTYIAVKFPLYDSKGRIYAIGGISTDISERKRLEESFKAADTFFNMSFDLLVVAKGDHFIKINPAFTKTLGYNQKDMDAMSFLSLSSDPQRAKEAVEKLAKGGTLVDFTDYAICKDGSNKWINWNATVDLETGLMFGVARDITEVKVDEEMLNSYTQKLKENEQQIQAIFEGAPDPVIVIDSDSIILRWNPKAEAVFGWKRTEVIGKPLYDFIVPTRYRSAHKKGMGHFLKTEVGPILNTSTEIEAINKKGVEFPVSLSISPIKIGEKYLFVGFVRDITEKQKFIDELFENEEKLSLIIDNIGEGVIVANADKEVVIANNMANEIFGIEENETMPINLTDHFELYFPDEKTVFPSQNLPMERALNGEETNDVDVVLWDPVAKDKKRVLISGRSLVDQNNKVVFAVVTIKDISKYKQMEEELKDTEMKYRNLIGFRKSNDKEV